MIAVCAFVEQKNRILVCKRPAWMKMPGIWELPTGVLEDDEALEDCLERTCLETLSQRVCHFELENVQDSLEDGDCRMFVYRTQLENHFVSLERYSAFKWLKLNELGNVSLMQSSVTAIKLNNFHKKN